MAKVSTQWVLIFSWFRSVGDLKVSVCLTLETHRDFRKQENRKPEKKISSQTEQGETMAEISTL